MNSAAALLPPDVQQIVDQLDEADRTAEGLVVKLSDQQFNWQPDGGTRWSVAQCLEHLANADDAYLGPLREAVDRARQAGSTRQGPLAPGFFGRRFLNSLEPPVRYRVRSPSKIYPGSGLARTELLQRYRGGHDRVRRIAHDAAAIDANRVTFTNPFLKLIRVKVSTGLQVITAHNRRHLWQAAHVVARPDFPSR